MGREKREAGRLRREVQKEEETSKSKTKNIWRENVQKGCKRSQSEQNGGKREVKGRQMHSEGCQKNCTGCQKVQADEACLLKKDAPSVLSS